MNKNPLEASHWQGRILLHLRANDAKYPQHGKFLPLQEPESDDSEEEDAKKNDKGKDEKTPLLKKDKDKYKSDEPKVLTAFEKNNKKDLHKYEANQEIQRIVNLMCVEQKIF